MQGRRGRVAAAGSSPNSLVQAYTETGRGAMSAATPSSEGLPPTVWPVLANTTAGTVAATAALERGPRTYDVPGEEQIGVVLQGFGGKVRHSSVPRTSKGVLM